MDLDFSICRSERILSLASISFHLHYTVLVRNSNAESNLAKYVSIYK